MPKADIPKDFLTSIVCPQLKAKVYGVTTDILIGDSLVQHMCHGEPSRTYNKASHVGR
jgi:hypothetical protein